MAEYKNIPVDPETYEKLAAVAQAHGRKLGAQVKVWVNREWLELSQLKLLGAAEEVEQAVETVNVQG